MTTKKKNLHNPTKYLLISYAWDKSKTSQSTTPRIETQGSDYDKLLTIAQRHNESEKNLNRFYEVVDAADYERMVKHGKNPIKAAQRYHEEHEYTVRFMPQRTLRKSLRSLKPFSLNGTSSSSAVQVEKEFWTYKEIEDFLREHKISLENVAFTVQTSGRVMPYLIPYREFLKRVSPYYSQRNSGATDFQNFEKKRLTDLAKMFQGHSTGKVEKIVGPNVAPKGSYPLGHLVLMKVKYNGVKHDIHFDGDSMLTGDLRNNLWVKGKDALLTGLKKPIQNGLKYIGDLIQIDYVTAKSHIEGGKTVRFWHPLGEVNKEYPALYMDQDGFPIIVGGGYSVWSVGIVN